MARKSSKSKAAAKVKPGRRIPEKNAVAAEAEAVAPDAVAGLGVDGAIILTTTVLLLVAVSLTYYFLQQHYPAV